LWFGYAFQILALQLGSTVLPVRWPLACALIACALLGPVLARDMIRTRLRA
jgi:hypothetical protein